MELQNLDKADDVLPISGLQPQRTLTVWQNVSSQVLTGAQSDLAWLVVCKLLPLPGSARGERACLNYKMS